jgi:hypothetical protein
MSTAGAGRAAFAIAAARLAKLGAFGRGGCRWAASASWQRWYSIL